MKPVSLPFFRVMWRSRRGTGPVTLSRRPKRTLSPAWSPRQKNIPLNFRHRAGRDAFYPSLKTFSVQSPSLLGFDRLWRRDKKYTTKLSIHIGQKAPLPSQLALPLPRIATNSQLTDQIRYKPPQDNRE